MTDDDGTQPFGELGDECLGGFDFDTPEWRAAMAEKYQTDPHQP